MKLSALIDASERSGKRSARCSLVILLRWRSLMVGSLSPNRVLHPERPCAICVVAEVRVGITLGHVLTLRTGYWLGGMD